MLLITPGLYVARTRFVFLPVISLILMTAGNLMMQPVKKHDRTPREGTLRDKFRIEGVIVQRPEARDGGLGIVIRPTAVSAEDGQGEATLITFADGRRMFIDGGGAQHESSRDIGRQLLLPALREMGVNRIDYLVLTHAHPDHLQGGANSSRSTPCRGILGKRLKLW